MVPCQNRIRRGARRRAYGPFGRVRKRASCGSQRGRLASRARGAGAALDLLEDSSDAVKRAAAEALGRIGDSSAVGPLLEAAGRAEGEVLTHSLVYALIEIADPRATRAGLSSLSARTRRAALIALDQMRPAVLGSDTVLPLLRSPEPLISDAASWIASRHPEWGGALSGYLAGRLGERPIAEPGDLEGQLQSFAGNPSIQALLAGTARGDSGAQARQVALEAMAGASVDEVPDGWEATIAVALGRKDTVEAALRAARGMPPPDEVLPRLDAALLGVASDPAVAESIRIRALAAGAASLGGLDPALYALAVGEVHPSGAVRDRAAAATVLSEAPLNRDQLLDLADLLPEVGPMELPRIVAAFRRSDDAEVGARFADRLSQARGLANLRADVAASATRGFPPRVRERVDALLVGEVAGLAEQNAMIDRMLDSLPPGDVVRGQAVFNSAETACMACHAIGYQGGKIGPDLTRIGQIRERRDLLEAIVYPSASFVCSFEPVVAVTADQSLNGVVLEESDTHLLLALDAESQAWLARSEIEKIRPGTVSAMPSGLAEQVSRGDLADLLAFLEATQWGPRASRR